MSKYHYAKEVLKPVVPVASLLLGGIGFLYNFGTGAGGRKLMAICLMLILVSISIFAAEVIRKSEFFKRNFADKSKKKKNHHKRMGKKCSQCGKMIHHRRMNCQHCGLEFTSKKYQDELQKKRFEKNRQDEVHSDSREKKHV